MALDIANSADIAQLAELLQLLFAQEQDFTPDTGKQTAALQQIIAAPDIGFILVWREAGMILGMVNLLFTVSTAEGGKVALLEDLIVRPGHRRAGIGARLLDAAVERCKVLGCSRITLLTDSSNTAATRFYARKGFSASVMQPMRLYIDLPKLPEQPV